VSLSSEVTRTLFTWQWFLEASICGILLQTQAGRAKGSNERKSHISLAVLQGLSGVTAALTFRKDGLHALVSIDRK
jgi:hypothetical protein